MQPPCADVYFRDATAPPPSVCSVTVVDHDQHGETVVKLREYGKRILRVAQNAVNDIDARQTVDDGLRQLGKASQYCNNLGFVVKAGLRQVIVDLDASRLQLRVVISQDDALSSVKSQILNHKPIFEQKGYPAWSKDILGARREYKNHPWCHLVFQGGSASAAKSMRSDFMHLYTAYTDVQRALDVGAIEDLQDYIQVLKSLDQIYERVERYGMCSTEYQVTVRSGLTGRDKKVITAGPDGCRMSDADASSFESTERGAYEVVVWPAPASGRHLPRQSLIVKQRVAKEVAASKFRALQLREVEDLGLHKLKDGDLRLLLNTQRFSNAAELLAQKLYLGNHVTDGHMSNLARQWLLGVAEGNETAFKHLLLLPDRTSIDLVRVMMTAVALGEEYELRSLCWEIYEKKNVFDCCEAIASASLPSGIVARVRLCMACVDPAFSDAIRNATVFYRTGSLGRTLDKERQSSLELKIMLRLAEADTWRLKLTAYIHLKEIGSTSHSAAIHAGQIRSDEEAQKLEELVLYLNNSSMRREIVDASRGLQELGLYVKILTGEQLADAGTSKALLMQLLRTAGYTSMAQLHVPIEPGSEQQNVAAWMSSGPSEGVCMFGEIFVRHNLEDRNPAPPRDSNFLQALTGKARLSSDGKWEFFLGYRTEKTERPSFFLIFPIYSETTTTKTAVWKTLLGIDRKDQSHAHLSEQIYFYTDGGELPNAEGLSLLTLERDGVGNLVGRGLTITRRMARDIWHLGGDVYYSMSRGMLWRIETEEGLYYAGHVEKVIGNFIAMSRGSLENKTIS